MARQIPQFLALLFMWYVICKKLLKEARGKRYQTILKLQLKEFLVLKRYKDAKHNILPSNSDKRRLFMKGNWVTGDAPLDQGDSILLLFLISRWTWFLFYRLPFTGKKSYAKKQLLSTLLYLTQVWICVYFLVVLQLCFDFEARVWLVIR